MEEEWRRIEDFPDYRVSNYGNVYDDYKNRPVHQYSPNRYRTVRLHRGRETETVLVHRLVASAFVLGRSDQRYIVNHINGDRSYNAVENLEWVTPMENRYHAIQIGLQRSNWHIDKTYPHLTKAFRKTEQEGD
jgi:hypothetical protein